MSFISTRPVSTETAEILIEYSHLVVILNGKIPAALLFLERSVIGFIDSLDIINICRTEAYSSHKFLYVSVLLDAWYRNDAITYSIRIP